MKGLLLPVAAALLAGCAAGAPPTAPAVVVDEYTVHTPGRWPTGRTTVSVVNEGEVPHTVVVTDGEGRPVAVTDLVAPGEETDLVVDLSPGRYVVSCRIVVRLADGTVMDHLEAGMSRPVEIG